MNVGVSFLTGCVSSHDSLSQDVFCFLCVDRVFFCFSYWVISFFAFSFAHHVLLVFGLCQCRPREIWVGEAQNSSSVLVLSFCTQPSVSDGCCISGLLYGDRGVNNVVSSAAGDHSSSSSDHEEEDEEDEEAGLLSLFHSSIQFPFSRSCSFIPPSQICLFPSLRLPPINTHKYTHVLLSLTAPPDLCVSFLQVIHSLEVYNSHKHIHMYSLSCFLVTFIVQVHKNITSILYSICFILINS